MKHVGQTLVGKYQVNALIKNIGRTEIYQGTQIPIRKKVLIEIFPLEIGESLKLEDFFALTRLSHPNLSNLIDYGETEEESFLVFEMPNGETLKELIKRQGSLPLDKTYRILNQVASALQTAHLKNIIHGRLSSENVFICPLEDKEEIVKVFGFASYSYSDSPTLEEAEYLAPEQFSNFHLKDTRCDIYALGVIAYEMLTGKVPFSSTKLEDLRSKHLKEPPLPISAFRKDVSEELEAVIQRALAKNPDNRFQSIKGFAESFEFAINLSKKENLLKGESIYTESETLSSQEKISSGNNLWKTAFITLSGVLILGGFFIYLMRTKQINPPTALPIDVNGTPVQPISPATGIEEKALSNMKDFGRLNLSNSKVNPEIVKQGKSSSSNLWMGEAFVPPLTGQFYDGNVNPNSPFMPPDGNIYVLIPKNSNVSANSNTQKSKTLPSNSNSQTMGDLDKKSPSATQETKPKPTPTPVPNVTQSPTPSLSNKKP